MLGVRRVGVTMAAGELQRAGLISYHRGELTVVDRAGLERAACGCDRGPGDALWGAQTARSLRFFAIGEQRMPLDSCMRWPGSSGPRRVVNRDLGLLDAARPRPSPAPRCAWPPASSTPSSRCRSGRPARARRAT
jgi:hypothetical protein